MRDVTPAWVALSRAAVRSLPIGRYRAANLISRLAARPFLARMPADAGSHLFLCDLRDTISREVCFTGRYEPQETQLARQLLGRGMTVIDVGANWGYFTLLAAHLVGDTGRVIALEPHPRLHAMLSENVRRNSLDRVECVRRAAGAQAGVAGFASFREADGNWGTSRIVPDASPVDFHSETRRLDDLTTDLRLVRVDLVKIDVEGAEHDVLLGMSHGLQQGFYRAILLECHPDHLTARGVSLSRCLEPLRRAGYRGWRIDHTAITHRRAASGRVSCAELLTPLSVDDDSLGHWPHLLWLAPGVEAPA